MFASGNPIVTYTANAGSPPAIQTRPFPDRLSKSRGISNVSAGGHVVLTSSGVWRLHFGTGTDLSPVAEGDQIFTKVDLHEWTLGMSGTKGKFVFTAGLNYRAGSADDVIVHNLENGEAVRSGIDVRTIGLIYALAYKF